MLAKERQNMIVDIVNRKGSALVKQLSEKFNVTEDSIRKDLTLLEKKGLLKKTYGGAVKIRENVHDIYVSQRIGKNIEEKQAIAERAVKLIDDGDVIFLDISTTNIELIKLIIEQDLPIIVVTNMIDVMLPFTTKTQTKLIFLGGTLNRRLNGFVGDATSRQISEFKFDKVFMGAIGVDLEENSVYTYSIDDALTKKTIVESANEAYIMLENRKFSVDGNYRYSKATDFTGIVLDHEPEETVALDAEKNNIKLIS